jgi:hypothetical protein
MQREFKPKKDPLMSLELENAVLEVEKWTREEKNTETSFKVTYTPSINGSLVKQTLGVLEICEEYDGEQKCFLDGSIVTTIKDDTEMEARKVGTDRKHIRSTRVLEVLHQAERTGSKTNAC